MFTALFIVALAWFVLSFVIALATLGFWVSDGVRPRPHDLLLVIGGPVSVVWMAWHVRE